jgi:hypothetical protein
MEQTSAGDSLNAKFRTAKAGAAKRGAAAGLVSQFADTLMSAVQAGHLTIMRPRELVASLQLHSSRPWRMLAIA